MSKKLEEIRQKIDAIDDQVHDLLMERASLVAGVAAEKRKNDMPVVQPAREARMIRRLLSRHQGPLPEAAVVGIWRELVGAVSLLQTGLNVAVTDDGGDSPYWDMARVYFGSVLPMKKTSSALAAVGSVREGDASFAVLPWPDDRDENPWWVYMLNQDEPMRVVCALPYGCYEGETIGTHDKALVVSKIDFKESGDDYSFIALELAPDISRGRIVDVLTSLGLEPVSLHSKSDAGQDVPSLHLVEVAAFVDGDDTRLKDIQERFEGGCHRCFSLGGYPALPIFKNFKRKDKHNELPVAPKKQDKKKKRA